jgi:hypothetical protein
MKKLEKTSADRRLKTGTGRSTFCNYWGEAKGV